MRRPMYLRVLSCSHCGTRSTLIGGLCRRCFYRACHAANMREGAFILAWAIGLGVALWLVMKLVERITL